MPYITSIERMGIEQGLEQGLEKGLEQGLERQRSLLVRQLTRKVGPIGELAITQTRALSFDRLEELAEALFDFTSVDDLNRWLG